MKSEEAMLQNYGVKNTEDVVEPVKKKENDLTYVSYYLFLLGVLNRLYFYYIL